MSSNTVTTTDNSNANVLHTASTAAIGIISSVCALDNINETNNGGETKVDRIKLLYPNVNESVTPIPRCWNASKKRVNVVLSENNRCVEYKMPFYNKTLEPVSVRTAHSIPSTCGIYYFEVEILSKSKNSYVSIGLSTSKFRMNHLPGCDKLSYGYYGVNGFIFGSLIHGQAYGPTFTTGDIIGCCVNFVRNFCFYTKNGIDLGIAFRNLPEKLYPTVGLQAPAVKINVNFGQDPFKYDQFEGMMKQMHTEISSVIRDYPWTTNNDDLIQKLVSSYLVHYGYSDTVEAFARSTGQTFHEEMPSICNRQKIFQLIMSGKISEAIKQTLLSYPGLLENNENLWFMLKCRQFVEMIRGVDVDSDFNKTPTLSINLSNNNNNNHISSSNNGMSNVIACFPANYNLNSHYNNNNNNNEQKTTYNAPLINMDITNVIRENDKTDHTDFDDDIEMDQINILPTTSSNTNNFNNSIRENDDAYPSGRQCTSNIERIIQFGKNLNKMCQKLECENKMTNSERQMLEDAFSLIAYSDPWSSPLRWQFCPTKREAAGVALNSAILESMYCPKRAPLDYCVAHAKELLNLMAQTSLGECAFVNINDVFADN